MTEDGQPDPLNETGQPWTRRVGQMLAVVALIAVGVLAGARVWSPVKTVEQRVAAPIREVVSRVSPLENLPDLVDAACPAIVSLHLPGPDSATAQGIVLSGDGFILTTAALPDGATPDVWLDDGQRLKAEIAGREPLSGVTLLRVAAKNLSTVQLADPDLPRPGTRGFTLHSPAARGCVVDPAVAASDFVTEDAAEDYYVRVHGSGGPLVPGTPFLTVDGRVAAMAQPGRDPASGADRFLPADLLTTIVAYLMRNADPAPNPYGIIAEDLSPVLAGRLGADRGRGAVVIVVGPGSAAEKAGVRVGDVILSAGPSPVSSASELNRVLGGSGSTDLTISRASDEQPLTLTLNPPDATKTAAAK